MEDQGTEKMIFSFQIYEYDSIQEPDEDNFIDQRSKNRNQMLRLDGILFGMEIVHSEKLRIWQSV